MKSTNRAANRLLILASGLLLLVVGATTAAASLIPGVQDMWRQVSDRINAQVSTWLQQTPLGDTGVSWIMPAVLAVLVVGVIILIVLIARQGHGRTGTAVSQSDGRGTTIIDSTVPERALQDALAGRPEFLTSRVATYNVRRTPVLEISITCRRGVSPRDAASIVEGALGALDELLGRQLPALVHISGGLRSNVANTTRLQ